MEILANFNSALFRLDWKTNGGYWPTIRICFWAKIQMKIIMKNRYFLSGTIF